MRKPSSMPEITVKSTKEQILSAYNEVLSKLEDKQMISPVEEKQKQEKETIVSKAANNSADAILNDLNNLKSKTIKQIDNLSEQLITEFEKLTNLREAIEFEQKHLQELYKINEVADTLSALLQTQIAQKEVFKAEMENAKEAFEEDIALQKANWHNQKEQLEKEYKEKKIELEKSRSREEELYLYELELKRRKETDEYNTKKADLEKLLSDSREDLKRREDEILSKEEEYRQLKQRMEQFPEDIRQAVGEAEEKLRNEILEKYDFEKQLKQKEYEGSLAIKEQNIKYLENRVGQQEALIKELTAKNTLAAEQVQSIACRALDTSAQRFIPLPTSSEKDKTS